MGRGTKKENRWAIAAYTVAVAAAVGGPALAGNEAPEAAAHAVRSIEKYCCASWRNAGINQQEWSDFTQQAVTELLDRVSADGLPQAIKQTESTERQELNRAVWRIIQRWRRSPRIAPLYETVAKVDRAPLPGDWSDIVSVARECLSKRQLTILSRLREGWRVHEIAQELGVSAARVSDEKYKAIQKLRETFA